MLFHVTTGWKKIRTASETQVVWKPVRNKVKCVQNNHTSNSTSIISQLTRLGQKHSRKVCKKNVNPTWNNSTCNAKDQFNLPKQYVLHIQGYISFANILVFYINIH